MYHCTAFSGPIGCCLQAALSNFTHTKTTPRPSCQSAPDEEFYSVSSKRAIYAYVKFNWLGYSNSTQGEIAPPTSHLNGLDRIWREVVDRMVLECCSSPSDQV